MIELLNENIGQEDLKKFIKEFYNYAREKLNIDAAPRLLLRNDENNAKDFFGKTGGYDPNGKTIHLYITNRHPKDIIRSFSHELVHHAQNLKGFGEGVDMNKTGEDESYAQHDEALRELERDAFERGNLIFRDWTDGEKLKRKTNMNEKKSVKVKAKKAVKKEMEMPELSEAEKIKAEAQRQAKEDSAHARTGGFPKPKPGDAEEGIIQENNEKDEKIVHPHPELFIEKERLLKDTFNTREERVYQELIRRIIKK